MIRKCLEDRSGAAAVEFGLIAPIIAGIVALGWNTWQGERGLEQAKTALRAGAMYYNAGGTTDSVVPSVIMSAWSSAPKNASATVVKACYCNGLVISCTLPCTIGQQRTAFVTLTVTGTGQGVFADQAINEQEIVRVE